MELFAVCGKENVKRDFGWRREPSVPPSGSGGVSSLTAATNFQMRPNRRHSSRPPKSYAEFVTRISLCSLDGFFRQQPKRRRHEHCCNPWALLLQSGTLSLSYYVKAFAATEDISYGSEGGGSSQKSPKDTTLCAHHPASSTPTPAVGINFTEPEFGFPR